MTRRNLIIIHRGPDYERDFDEIAAKVRARERSIAVYHLPSMLAADIPMSDWQYPTLTVSLSPSFRMDIRRGPVLKNRLIGKLAQQEIFRRNGIATPPALPFRFGMTLDPIMFGEFVVLKPVNLRLTSHGHGILLFRRRRAEQLRREALPDSHPLRSMESDFVVQRHIDTGPELPYTRVSSFLSQPLYTIQTKATGSKLDLSAPDPVLESTDITNAGDDDRVQVFAAKPDELALAKAVHAAMPDVPLLGIDVLREQRSGRLYVLEANPGGNNWHFSSKGGHEWRVSIARCAGIDAAEADAYARGQMIKQFGAFDIAADVLVQRTMELAA